MPLRVQDHGMNVHRLVGLRSCHRVGVSHSARLYAPTSRRQQRFQLLLALLASREVPFMTNINEIKPYRKFDEHRR